MRPTIQVLGDTIVIQDLHGQIFTWRDDATGQLLHFDVGPLQRHADAHPEDVELLEADMDDRFVLGTILARGWATAEGALALPAARMDVPLLGVELTPEPEPLVTLLVDG